MRKDSTRKIDEIIAFSQIGIELEPMTRECRRVPSNMKSSDIPLRCVRYGLENEQNKFLVFVFSDQEETSHEEKNRTQ